MVWQAKYDAFGKASIGTEVVENNLRFPGQYYDSETGLHYNWNRYYDPQTGRYMSVDPIGLEGGLNLYSYVQNNPVNRVDPEGLLWGWLYKFGKCAVCQKKMSDLGNGCIKEMGESCEENIKFQDKYGGISSDDSIRNCIKTKDPKLWEDWISNCTSTANTFSIPGPKLR